MNKATAKCMELGLHDIQKVLENKNLPEQTKVRLITLIVEGDPAPNR
ncbi:hypothetical protein [Paenibacillus sp. V4I7]|nr:hypothetical protein [Paenibacillus sp. V4I7]MDQ0899483.1 hypothetical protein [Paenibacillus sp. V4I7]